MKYLILLLLSMSFHLKAAQAGTALENYFSFVHQHLKQNRGPLFDVQIIHSFDREIQFNNCEFKPSEFVKHQLLMFIQDIDQSLYLYASVDIIQMDLLKLHAEEDVIQSLNSAPQEIYSCTLNSYANLSEKKYLYYELHDQMYLLKIHFEY